MVDMPPDVFHQLLMCIFFFFFCGYYRPEHNCSFICAFHLIYRKNRERETEKTHLLFFNPVLFSTLMHSMQIYLLEICLILNCEH